MRRCATAKTRLGTVSRIVRCSGRPAARLARRTPAAHFARNFRPSDRTFCTRGDPGRSRDVGGSARWPMRASIGSGRAQLHA